MTSSLYRLNNDLEFWATHDGMVRPMNASTKKKAQILADTELLTNELEAIRGKCGIVPEQFGAVVEIYKTVTNRPMDQAFETFAPMITELLNVNGARALPTTTARSSTPPRARKRRRS